MSNEKVDVVRRVIVRCRPNRAEKWREYVFPAGSEAAEFWHGYMELYPSSGQARVKYMVDAYRCAHGESGAVWWEPQFLPTPAPSQRAREAARDAAREWMNTHHASFKTNKEREDALVEIILRHLPAGTEGVGESNSEPETF